MLTDVSICSPGGIGDSATRVEGLLDVLGSSARVGLVGVDDGGFVGILGCCWVVGTDGWVGVLVGWLVGWLVG